jgi:hypothetical protein
MSISYPLAIPTTIGIEQITLRAVNVVALAQSPFTFRQQVFKYPGERWEASVSIPPLRRDFLEPWVAFLLALKGQTGTFLLGDPNNACPQGALSSSSNTVQVNGTPGIGTTAIPLKGLPVSTTGLLVPGDYIQLGAAGTATLHKVLLPMNSNSGGEGTVEVWPATRRALVDSETVVYKNTVGRFRLNQPFSEWAINNSNAYQLSFDAVEAV